MSSTKKNNKHTMTILEDITTAKSVRELPRTKTKKRKVEEDDVYLDEKMSKKILRQVRLQQQEEGPSGSTPLVTGDTLLSDDEEIEDNDEEEDVYEDIDIDPDEEALMQCFLKDNAPQRTLADIIMEKLTEKQTEVRSVMSDGQMKIEDMDPQLMSMFKDIGHILSKYRSGKLPKAFKIIPNMSNWEQVLYLTTPDQWSAAAMYQATRIFCSNLNTKMAQRFYNLVLLPRIRDDIAEYKRLNFHLYQALHKSLFKPAAFYKGLLLPLCESGTCSLREAVIISSVLAKHSVPMLHSAAALLRIAEMEYTGAASIFMRTLLDKKYALPYRVIDALVGHFLRFETVPDPLPVLWHQCLLTLCQRYKSDMSDEQKEALKKVLHRHIHKDITHLVHVELDHSLREHNKQEPMSTV